MTDAEVKKALECCNKNDCGRCEYEPTEHQIGTVGCSNELMKDALDLINRQQAEIEKMEAERMMADGYADALEQRAKAEAYKEFAERLKTKIINTPFGINCTGETDEYREGCLHGLVAKQNNVFDTIDNLLKEMVGDGSDS